MLRGIMITLFDFKIGPIPKVVYPNNFLGSPSIVYDTCVRIWTTLGIINLEEAIGVKYTYLSNVDMFVCVYFNKSDGKTYGIAAFFSKEDANVIVANVSKFEVLIKAHKIDINKGEDELINDAQNIFVDLDSLCRNIYGEILPTEKTKDEVYKKIRDFLSYYYITTRNIENTDPETYRKLKPYLDTLFESFSEIAEMIIGKENFRNLNKLFLLRHSS
ncbi:MAG: hypothetical protein ACTSWV_04440 [Candidatus Asgardarchaeia archaeon]